MKKFSQEEINADGSRFILSFKEEHH